MPTVFWLHNLVEGEHLEDFGTDDHKILKFFEEMGWGRMN
jgi:hypothetical protein